MKCNACDNEATIIATETDTGKEYPVCKPCSEKDDYYEIPGLEPVYLKTYQIGVKLRPMEIIVQ